MPRRKETGRKKRVNDRIIERLRASIAAGHPWLHAKSNESVVGQFDLLGLVFGAWYQFSHFIAEDSDDSIREMWKILRDDILIEHAKRRPGTRPSAWWRFQATEERRRIGGRGTVEGPLYFGAPSLYSECDPDDMPEFETEHAYLTRLGLLRPIEKEIFAKYGDIVFVRVSSGEYGKCQACWTDARQAAKEIDFNLDAAVLPYDTFWLPATLVFDCEHREWSSEGIFTVDYLA